MSRAAVEQYTGDGFPPYCEMTVRAADGSTPPDLTLPVTFIGVKQPTTITLEKVADKPLRHGILESLSEQAGMLSRLYSQQRLIHCGFVSSNLYCLDHDSCIYYCS